jgi:hypothetical protein
LPFKQNVMFGWHSFGTHLPSTQTLPSSVQSVPPARNPEPSALQVVKRFALQAGCPGEHKLDVQLAPLHVFAAQCRVVPQTSAKVELVPVALHE